MEEVHDIFSGGDRFSSSDGDRKCVSCDSRPKLRLLACFHRACVGCLERHLLPNGGVLCPRCKEVTTGYPSPLALPVCSSYRRQIPPQTLSDHGDAKESEGSTEELRPKRSRAVDEVCGECLEESAATASHWCRDCDCGLCDMHVSNHKKSRRTAKHKLASFGTTLGTQQRQVHSTRTASPRRTARQTLERVGGVREQESQNELTTTVTASDERAGTAVTKPDVGEPGDVPACPMHPDSPLLVFCKTCCALICERCKCLGYHSGKGHDLVDVAVEDLSKLAETQSKQIGDIARECKTKDLPKLKAKKYAIQAAISKVNDSAETVSQQVTHAIAEVMKRVEDGLQQQIDTLRWHRLKELEVKEEALRSMIDWAEDGLRLCQEAGAGRANSPEAAMSDYTELIQTVGLIKSSFSHRKREYKHLQHFAHDESVVQYIPGEKANTILADILFGKDYVPAAVKCISATAVPGLAMEANLRPPLVVESDGKVYMADAVETSLQIPQIFLQRRLFLFYRAE